MPVKPADWLSGLHLLPVPNGPSKGPAAFCFCLEALQSATACTRQTHVVQIERISMPVNLPNGWLSDVHLLSSVP